MSYVKLEQIKAYLLVTHYSDDVKLQELIDGAEDEALQFLNSDSLPRRNVNFDSNVDEDPVSDSDDLAPSVRAAIYLLVQAMYEGATPEEMTAIRKAAETKMMPYRGGLGV